jgi:hypothetical protein
MNVRTFALLFGVIFLAVGALGFVPGAVTPGSHPGMTMDQGYGLLLGLFPVNLLHNIAHLLFGVWGVLARSAGAARNYFRGVAIIYGLLTLMGLLPAPMNITFGLVPLFGHDIWLHGVLAAAGVYFGWLHRDSATA